MYAEEINHRIKGNQQDKKLYCFDAVAKENGKNGGRSAVK